MLACRYTGDATQKTGVAIETRGFTFVTSGKRRDTLTGEATLRFYDHLQVRLGPWLIVTSTTSHKLGMYDCFFSLL